MSSLSRKLKSACLAEAIEDEKRQQGTTFMRRLAVQLQLRLSKRDKIRKNVVYELIHLSSSEPTHLFAKALLGFTATLIFSLGTQVLATNQSERIFRCESPFEHTLTATHSRRPRSSVETLYEVGEKYERGIKVLRNYRIALKYYRRAASGNYAPAQSALGRMYQNGRGVRRNLETATFFFLKASLQNDSNAQRSIGLLYLNREGRAVDIAQAVSWLQVAAKNHSPCAQNDLGVIYSGKYGQENDCEKSIFWYRTSAMNGCAEGLYNLSQAYYFGIGVPRNLESSFYLMKKSASLGLAAAQCDLATKYLNGVGIFTDQNSAFRWFSEAASQGDVDGLYNEALCYEWGTGCERNPQKAAALYRKCKIKNHAQAINNLGLFYLLGYGVRQNSKTAFDLFLTSAVLGEPKGLDNLTRMKKENRVDGIFSHKFGQLEIAHSRNSPECVSARGILSCASDGLDKGEAFLIRAATQNFAPAQFLLADLYERRILPNGGKQKAIYWFGLAAANHQKNAQVRLDALRRPELKL